MRYWLIKSEPDAFSIDDLKNAPAKTEHWDGVRNYQARNYMRDDMQKGDGVFFYHSNCETPGIVGIAEIASKAAYPDHTAFDPNDHHFDAKSDPENPRWMMVDVRYKRKTKRLISLAELKLHEDRLQNFALVRRGNRLSVMPVEKAHWDFILELEQQDA
jgi:predicted RNA-binding protein with PUA-like domain